MHSSLQQVSKALLYPHNVNVIIFYDLPAVTPALLFLLVHTHSHLVMVMLLLSFPSCLKPPLLAPNF